MKILFLDIDGVLNNPKTKEKCCGYRGVDRAKAYMLSEWLKERDVKVVLSSTWRLHPEMHSHIRGAGIGWVGVTPDFGGLEPRGSEIDRWLEENKQSLGITDYAIVDDMPEMLPHQLPFFVQTNELEGITRGDLMNLAGILKA